jgi:hypothetical protein
MGPCCKFCYDTYLNTDRTIDESMFNEAYKKHYQVDSNPKILLKKESYQPSKKGRFKFLKRMPEPVVFLKYSMMVDDKEIEICNCECHIKGIVCLH